MWIWFSQVCLDFLSPLVLQRFLGCQYLEWLTTHYGVKANLLNSVFKINQSINFYLL